MCASEADKEYKRQFPDGPKPLATFQCDNPADMAALKGILGGDGLTSAAEEAKSRVASGLLGKILAGLPDHERTEVTARIVAEESVNIITERCVEHTKKVESK